MPLSTLVLPPSMTETTGMGWTYSGSCASRRSTAGKKSYGGMLPSEARELKQLREESTRLKRVVADLTLDKVMLQDLVQKRVLKPVKQREVVHYLMGRYTVSERRATRAAPFLNIEQSLREPS